MSIRWYLLVALVVSACVLTGCSTYAVPRYAMSADNVTALRSLRGQPVRVGAFKSKEEATSSIDCRAVGPIKTPDDEPFSQYIRNALVTELKMAEVYSDSGSVTLTGTLDHIDFSSTSGAWELALTVSSSNGKSMHVDETYHFDSSFVGETACNQTAQAFVPGVQDLIGKLVRDPAFRSLVTAAEVAQAPRAP